MEIKPNCKLLTKQWLILSTISLLLTLVALLLQILIPLQKSVSAQQVAAILWPIAVGLILLLWAVAAPIVLLWIRNLVYVIEEDRITIHKGILTKVQQNIPYRAITDFMLHRSLYDRFLGIGAIRIQTAGQAQTMTGFEGQLAGLLQWDDLLRQLRERIKRLHPLAEAITTAESATLLRDDGLTRQILQELQAVRKLLEGAIDR